MTFHEENRRTLVTSYLVHAAEHVASAQVLLETGHYGDAISRAYYVVNTVIATDVGVRHVTVAGRPHRENRI